MRGIQNKLHIIGTYDVCKILMIKDILDDGINGLAYFHKNIED